MAIIRRTFVATAAMSLVSAVRAAGNRVGVYRSRTRPKVICGIPDRDYIHGATYGPALALSQTALLITAPGAVPPDTFPTGDKMLSYQLNQSELRINHCSISRVSLAIRSDGHWILSFRADQNLRAETDPPLIAVGRPVPNSTVAVAPSRVTGVGSTATTLFTEHIKRNLFTVAVRGYAEYLTDVLPDVPPGHPVLFALTPEPFWVQRHVPLFPRFVGDSTEIQQAFGTIDRVEIQLTYR